jgi:Peptidase inhibitor family I36
MKRLVRAIVPSRFARLCALGAVAAIAATAAWSGAPPKAEADPPCGVRLLCLYSGVDFSGLNIPIAQRDIEKLEEVEVDADLRGRVSSWINTTGMRLCGKDAKRKVLWTGSAFTRDEYVGDAANNKTRYISFLCGPPVR